MCRNPAVDVHHIVERKLFSDGGYYLENAASVCSECHLLAEATTLSCDHLRNACNIVDVVLPSYLYRDQEYDKWGNPILPNGQRLRGELFHDISVQRILAPVLHLFTTRVKYPRTYHLPWSPGATKDDRIMEDLSGFEGEEVVVTVKMDGEQTTLYADGFHARSLDTPSHPSRDWLWAVQRRIGHEIPDGWRICGENLYAKHSIRYHHLPDLFLVFSIWNEKNVCLSWRETKEWCELLGLTMVPQLVLGRWKDEYKEKLVPYLYDAHLYSGDEMEGYVMRVSRAFSFSEFRHVVGKYVRANHVQTSNHWIHQALVKNEVSE